MSNLATERELTEVSETPESVDRAKDDLDRKVILEEDNTKNYYWIVPFNGQDYIIPKFKKIKESQYLTTQALFNGYQGIDSEFTLLKPATVSLQRRGRWMLLEKGELSYSEN